jgi:hypothetical protein
MQVCSQEIVYSVYSKDSYSLFYMGGQGLVCYFHLQAVIILQTMRSANIGKVLKLISTYIYMCLYEVQHMKN